MLELPEIRKEDFEEVLEGLKKRIPSLCADWKNLSESSPGIMLLELLTYIALEQRGSMNKIGGGTLINLGRLMGFTPERLSPARGFAALPRAAAKGRKLRAGSLVFEAERDFAPCGSSPVMYGRCGGSGGIVPVCRVSAKTPPQRLFSGGSSFVIGFDTAFPAGEEIRLTLCFDTQGRVIPAGISSAPWGNILRWQYYSGDTADGWRNIEMISDGTLSCFRTGELVFRISGEHRQLSGVYPLRCFADIRRIDLLPLLTGAYTNGCPVRQTDTKCCSVTFNIDEFRRNRMVFSDALAEKRIFRLMVNSSMGWCDAEDMNIAFDVVREREGFRLATSSRKDMAELFSATDGSEVLMLIMYEREYVREFTRFYSDGSSNQRIPLNFSGAYAPETELMAAREADGVLYWSRWSRSDKLAQEPPERLCFTVENTADTAGSCLVFGDKLHGAIPPRCGGKSVMLTTLRLTSGAAGNISQCPAECGEEPAAIISRTEGGTNEDTPDSFFGRVMSSPKSGTLLTLPDYEKAAAETEGIMLRAAQAYCTRDRAGKVIPNSVTLLAEPRTDREDHSCEGLEWYAELILRRLEALRTINTKVTVRFPEYIPVNAELSIEAAGFISDAEREAEDCVRRYFEENSGGVIDAARLTRALTELPEIAAVRSVRLSEPILNGSFDVPEGSRVYLRDLSIYCADRR